jgi:hypothetical protein
MRIWNDLGEAFGQPVGRAMYLPKRIYKAAFLYAAFLFE